jgi:uncharacterized protein YbjQ (UPF0145 family)
MAKVNLNDLSSLANETSVIATINANNAAIEEGFNNTISRDGTSPNTMEDDLNMNTHRIYNVPLVPLTNADVATKYYVDVLAGSLDPGNDAFENINVDGNVTAGGTIQGTDLVATNDLTVSGNAIIAGNIDALTASIDSYIDLTEISEPASPGANVARLFTVDEGDSVTQIKMKDAAGTVSPMSHFLQAGTGAVTRNVRTKLREYISITDFGASPSETAANNTTFITAAFTAAVGRSLLIPAGEYTHDGLTLPDGIHIFGEGEDSILKLDDASDTYVLNRSLSSSGIRLENFAINGNKANQTAGSASRGIRLVNASRAIIRGLYIYDCEDHGIHISNSGSETDNLIEGNTIVNCGLNNSSVGGSGIAGTDCVNDRVVNNKIRGSYRAGIRYSGSGHTVVGNQIADCANGGILPTTGSSLWTITGNTIVDCSDAGAVDRTILDGIRLVGTDHMTVTGNTISGNDGCGIRVFNGCNHIVISGNICRNNGQSGSGHGVEISNTGTVCSHVAVTGNHLYDDQGSPTQEYGLSIENGTTDVVHSGNLYSGNATGDVNISATGANVTGQAVKELGTWRVAGSGGAAVSHTGNTNETALATVTIPANAMGANGVVRVTSHFTNNNSANNKTARIRFNTITGSIYKQNINTTVTGFITQIEIHNRNATNSQVGAPSSLTTTFGTTSGTTVTSAIDTTADSTVVISGQLANSGDTITLESYLVEVLYRA